MAHGTYFRWKEIWGYAGGGGGGERVNRRDGVIGPNHARNMVAGLRSGFNPKPVIDMGAMELALVYGVEI